MGKPMYARQSHVMARIGKIRDVAGGRRLVKTQNMEVESAEPLWRRSSRKGKRKPTCRS